MSEKAVSEKVVAEQNGSTLAGVAGPSSGPIFIVGCPRSGTTLLRTIIASHSRMIVSPESHFFNYWLKEYGHLNLQEESEFQRFWQDFSTSQRFAYFDLDAAAFLAKLRRQDEISFRSVFALLMAEYAALKQKPRWGEKTPAHYDYLETIFDWFPNAKILWLIRDPRAVVASLLKVEWSSKYTFNNAYYWLSSAKLYLEQWSADPRVMRINYEALVTDPEANIEALCQFLGEELEPGMLSQRSEKNVPNPHQGGWAKAHLQQVMQPIGQQSVEKWRSQLSKTQVAIVEHITRDAMVGHGYEPLTSQMSAWQARYLSLSQRLDRTEGKLQKLRSQLLGGPSLAAKWVGATPKSK